MFMGDGFIVVLWIVPVVLFIITPLITLLIYSLGFFNPLFKDQKEDTQTDEKETELELDAIFTARTSSGK